MTNEKIEANFISRMTVDKENERLLLEEGIEYPDDDLRTFMTLKIMDVKDRQVRNGLKQLGWLSPNEAKALLTNPTGAEIVSTLKCGCVIADSKNTPAVRDGYEMGGYVKSFCSEHGAPDPMTTNTERAALWEALWDTGYLTREQTHEAVEAVIAYCARIPQADAGHVLVPREPTREMVAAACRDHGFPDGQAAIYVKGYRSMIEAALKEHDDGQ